MKEILTIATTAFVIGGTGAIIKQPALTLVGVTGTLTPLVFTVAKQKEQLQQLKIQHTHAQTLLYQQEQISQQVQAFQIQLKQFQQSVDKQIEQIYKQNEKQQNQINIQNTRQRLILSSFDKLRHQQKETQKEITPIKQQIDKIKQDKDQKKKSEKTEKKLVYLPENPNSSSIIAHCYIDGNNLGFAAEKMKIQIDYISLKILLADLAKEANLLTFNYYLGVSNQISQRKQAQIRQLKTLGYKVTTFPQVQREDGQWKTIGDDIGIAVDIMKEVKKGDIVLLVSGDGDYIPVLTEIKNRGAFIIVLSQSNLLNSESRKLADRVIILDEHKEELAKYRKLNIA